MTFYHATPKRNIPNIIQEGLKPGIDGAVYLCKTPIDCLKFFAINPMNRGREYVVIPIELDESQVKESFDHNKEYFQCEAYTHDGPIPEALIKKRLDDFLLFRFER